MADNVTADAGSGGAVFASDDIGGVHYPIGKITFGALDAQTLAASGAGAVSAGVQRVTLASDDPAVALLGTIDADTGAIKTAVEGTLAVSNGGLTELAAAINANEIDVNIATDSVGIGGGTQYTEDAAAPANPVGNALMAERDDALAGLTPAEGDWSHMFCDADGALWVKPSGTVTVDGTVTANLGAVDNAVLDSIVTNTTGLAGTVSGSELQVDVVAALPAGTNNIGDVDIASSVALDVSAATVAVSNTGLTDLAAAINANEIDVNIATDSVGIGGGTQYTEDAAAAADPVGNAQILVRDDAPVSIAADGDNVARRGTEYGAAYAQIVDSSGNFVDSFGGAGGTATADDADFAAGTTEGTIAQGVYESAPSSVTDGDVGAVGITQTRSLKVEETNSTAILADTANMDTNLGTVAGAVTGTEMQVDVVAALPAGDNNIGNVDVVSGTVDTVTNLAQMGGTALSMDEGTVDAGTQRVSLATDDDGVAHLATLAGAVAGSEMQVDVVAALPAGDNNIGNVDIASSVALDVSAATVTVDGTVTANPASGTIDTVTNLAQLGGAAIAMNEGALAAGVQRVSLATDDDLVAHGATIAGDTTSIDGKITACNTGAIAGTVTANLSATDNTVLDNIDTNTTGLAGTVSGSELQVDVVAALPAGTNAIGKLAANSGVDIGDVDVTSLPASTNTLEVVGDVAHDAAAAGNPVLVAARATASVEGNTEVAGDDASFIASDLSGAVITRAACAPEELVSFYVANTDGAEDAVTGLDAGGATIFNYITSVTVHNAHASTNGFVSLLDGSAGSIFWVFPAPATGGTTMNFDPPLKQKTVNTALYVDVSGAITTMYISVAGYQGQG